MNQGGIMRLEIQSIDIRDIREGSSTHAKDHVLNVNKAELEKIILQDVRIKSVDINIVRPGDKARILNLMDVVQPRCKIGNPEGDFPGFIGKMQTAGVGITRSLRGVTVLVSNPDTQRKYSAFLDMSGLVAEISRYGKMRHVHIAPIRAEETDERDYEDAVKNAGFRTAVYLARSAEGHSVDDVEVFDLDLTERKKDTDLPRVAYYFLLYSAQHDHLGISDPVLYGTEIRDILPTVLHPNEILDGGVVGAHSIRALDTYTIQNHAVIKELYRRHGKDLIFTGVVCGVAKIEESDRLRTVMMASNLILNVLGADAVILTKVHGGMPHVDVGLVAERCEKAGVKTAVYIQPGISFGTLADTLIYSSEAVNLIMSVGATMERAKIPLDADYFLGGNGDTKIFCPDPIIQHANDPVVDVEEFLIAGVHDNMGGSNIIVKEY
jgi:hypothetical protein